MNGGAHISQEDLALYAMQTLRGEELDAVRAHLQTCAECRQELNAIASDLTGLALGIEQQPVPARARQRFMDSIAAEARPAAVTPAAPVTISSTKTPAKTAWVPWAIAAALAVGTAWMGMKINTLHEQLRRQSLEVAKSTEENVHSQRVLNLLMAPSAQRVTLKASKTPVEPTGHAIYLADRGELIFQANNLKSLPEGKTYELWLIPANGNPSIPAGLFQPDKSGDASVVLPPLPVGVAAKAFGVTIEKAEGSSTPTAPIVLSGAPTSGE
jgi:anti-sigma-K factor RskA